MAKIEEHSSVDVVISEFARRCGPPVLPRRPDGVPVDLELVNQLRDEANRPAPGLPSG